MTLHSPTENSLAVLNHKILEANSQVQNVKLGGHQTCLSINRLWHELCDMLRRLVGTTAPGHHDCSIQERKSPQNLSLQGNTFTPVVSRSFELPADDGTIWLGSTLILREIPWGGQGPPTYIPLPPTTQEDWTFDSTAI
ncbi:uncharacterized protein TNCV_1254601 [Trichonephila clavipes]|nr:uncharacterized protein TNCV_1254601 [Trichonephila clavipes]